MRYVSLGDALTVSEVCIGTSPLGGMKHLYGHDVTAADAIDTVAAAFASPVTFIDTSNEYGGGESERRIGTAIRAGLMPDGFAIATKADPLPGGDFSAARVRASLEESLDRLGVDAVDVFYLHDPERLPFEANAAPGGALDGMRALKEDGRVGMIGVAGGDLDEMRRYVDTGLFDVLLNHNHFTVLDQSASPLIDHAVDAGLAFVNAAPYASGILAKAAQSHPRYRYGSAPEDVVALVARIRALCEAYAVDIAAVALQFSTRDPRITSTVVGVSRPGRVDELVRNTEVEIPDALWPELAELVAAAR